MPTRDRTDFLEGCLKALRGVIGSADEVVVVDSASNGTRTKEVAEAFGARYLRCDRPGASRARNAGWRNARHPLVAFIDDDVCVWEGWADALACCSAAFPEAAFVSTKIGSHKPGSPEGPPEYPLALKLEPDPAWMDTTTPNPIGHSASLAVRRDALEAVRGFDEMLGPGGPFRAAEDQDLFDRLFKAGYRGRYEPLAFVVHDAWRSRSEIIALEWAYGIGSGARMSKLLKGQRERLHKVVRENVWHFVRGFFHSVRVRYRFLVVVSVVRLAGTVVGFVRALPRPVVDGHLQPMGRRARPGS